MAIETVPWTITERVPAKVTVVIGEASAKIDGLRLNAKVDEYGATWHIFGSLAGIRVMAFGDLGASASLDEARTAAEAALPVLRAAGWERRL